MAHQREGVQRRHRRTRVGSPTSPPRGTSWGTSTPTWVLLGHHRGALLCDRHPRDNATQVGGRRRRRRSCSTASVPRRWGGPVRGGLRRWTCVRAVAASRTTAATVAAAVECGEGAMFLRGTGAPSARHRYAFELRNRLDPGSLLMTLAELHRWQLRRGATAPRSPAPRHRLPPRTCGRIRQRRGAAARDGSAHLHQDGRAAQLAQVERVLGPRRQPDHRGAGADQPSALGADRAPAGGHQTLHVLRRLERREPREEGAPGEQARPRGRCEQYLMEGPGNTTSSAATTRRSRTSIDASSRRTPRRASPAAQYLLGSGQTCTGPSSWT